MEVNTHSWVCTDMNVVPADVMAEMGAQKIIAVDVSKEEKSVYYDYGTELSGLWLLWNSWNPFVQTVSGLFIANVLHFFSQIFTSIIKSPLTGKSP